MYKICRTEKSLSRQRVLEDGFLEYMDIVPFSQIDISGLCRHLNIPRKTFYRYFGSKEEALFALIDHRLLDMENQREELHSQAPRSLRGDIIHYFSFWKNQRRFLDILDRNYLHSVVVVRSVLQAHVMLHLTDSEKHISDSQKSYMVNFMVSGLVSMMMQWYLRDFQESEDALADLAEVLFKKPLSQILDYRD